MAEAGLFISLEKPYIGATPDGIMTCDCCEQRALEIKCPYCFKDGLHEDDADNFCMEQNEKGEWVLRHSHSYYYQVQVQLNVCEIGSGDFVVWTENGILTEKIYRDQIFYDKQLQQVQYFHVYGILPELIDKWYTRKPVVSFSDLQESAVDTNEDDDDDDPTKLWCYCSQPNFGEMILCDNKHCTIKWFHFDCLRIRCSIKGKWYCPSCRKLPQFNRQLTKKIPAKKQ